MSKSDSGFTLIPVRCSISEARSRLAASLTSRHARLKLSVVSELFQFAQPSQIAEPAIPDTVGDEPRKGRIAHGDEAPRRDAVGYVEELLRPQLGKVTQDRLPEQIGMQSGNAVDMMAADGREICHAHEALAIFIDKRHARDTCVIAGIPGADLVQETAVDFKNDFQMARQKLSEERHGPFLQRLRQQRVIGVGEGVLRDVPGGVPVELVFINEQSHQLRHGQRRVRVVQLHGPFLVKRSPAGGRAASERGSCPATNR